MLLESRFFRKFVETIKSSGKGRKQNNDTEMNFLVLLLESDTNTAKGN